MSPATKSKDKKEASKPSQKPNTSMSAASAYNPILGTFQVLDTSTTTPFVSPLQHSRFRSIDETDVTESDGSCSGDSEEHKEKTTTSHHPQKQEVMIVPGADGDKREKVRQKNERKHQRQKERRTQELHEKCSTYLMSRKLEALTQKIVAMGISQEHATTALMMNGGKVEESVDWLFDRGEEEIEKQSRASSMNLKIDITEEVARITRMEMEFKCTKQEIERAVVQAEGDLDRAEEVMKGAKHEEVKLETQSVPVPIREDKSFNYTKSPSPSTMVQQPMKRLEQKLEWPNPQQSAALVDKRVVVPTASYSLPSSPSSPPQPVARLEARYIANGIEFKSPQQTVNREPVVAMRQRPQPVVPSSPTTNWYPVASMEMMMKSNGFIQQPHNNIPTTRSPSPNNLNPNQIYQQLQYQQNQKRFSNNQVDPHGGIARGNRNTASSSPPISAASSLGLFSAVGSAGTSGASSPVNWSSGGSVDYANIDWSLDQGLSQNSRHNELWSGLNTSSHMYDASMNRYSLQSPMGGRVNSSNGVSMQNVEPQTVTSQDWTSPFEGKDFLRRLRQYASPSL